MYYIYTSIYTSIYKEWRTGIVQEVGNGAPPAGDAVGGGRVALDDGGEAGRGVGALEVQGARAAAPLLRARHVRRLRAARVRSVRLLRRLQFAVA